MIPTAGTSIHRKWCVRTGGGGAPPLRSRNPQRSSQPLPRRIGKVFSFSALSQCIVTFRMFRAFRSARCQYHQPNISKFHGTFVSLTSTTSSSSQGWIENESLRILRVFQAATAAAAAGHRAEPQRLPHLPHHRVCRVRGGHLQQKPELQDVERSAHIIGKEVFFFWGGGVGRMFKSGVSSGGGSRGNHQRAAG